MNALHEALRWLHVVPGFIGLLVFWFPVFLKKGSNRHIFFGRIFLYAAYIVLLSALAGVGMYLIEFNGKGVSISDRPDLYGFVFFLGYLSVVTLTMVRHGVGVLRTKNHPAALATPLNTLAGIVSIAASIAIIYFAMRYKPDNRILLYALSPIGLFNGLGILAYLHRPPKSSRQWFYEHMGAMLGAGIAFHTAFAVFGINQLFNIDLPSPWNVLPWVTPAAIGIPAIFIWTRHYRRKFGDIGGGKSVPQRS